MDSYTKTARFYSDIAWYVYSTFGVVPLFVIAIYRFFNQPKNLDQISDKNPPPADKFTPLYKFLTYYAYV